MTISSLKGVSKQGAILRIFHHITIAFYEKLIVD